MGADAAHQLDGNWFLRNEPKLDLTSLEEDFIVAMVGRESKRWDGDPDVEAMNEILDHHPNVLDRIGSRLLTVAIGKRGCGPAIKFLLATGVSLDIDETSYNVLHEAAWANSVDTLKSVFESGVTDATGVSRLKATYWLARQSLVDVLGCAHSGFAEMADLLLEVRCGYTPRIEIPPVTARRGTTSLQEAVSPPPLNRQGNPRKGNWLLPEKLIGPCERELRHLFSLRTLDEESTRTGSSSIDEPILGSIAQRILARRLYIGRAVLAQ